MFRLDILLLHVLVFVAQQRLFSQVLSLAAISVSLIILAIFSPIILAKTNLLRFVSIPCF